MAASAFSKHYNFLYYFLNLVYVCQCIYVYYACLLKVFLDDKLLSSQVQKDRYIMQKYKHT